MHPAGLSLQDGHAFLPFLRLLTSTTTVNESCVDSSPAVSLGQTRHEQQVASVHHQSTVCNLISVDSRMRMATLNVNTLYQARKLHNVEREMKRLHVDVLGVAEARWTGVRSVGHSEGRGIIYSGGESHFSDVAVALGDPWSGCLQN